MKFWDSSALVPLLIEESSTEIVRRVLREDRSIVAWAGSAVEVTSAVWRRVRDGQLGEEPARVALSGLEELERVWTAVEDLDRVQSRARRLLAVHPLRAADALQLAAALVVCDERTRALGFVTLDQRLADAARREGFGVYPG